MMKRLALILIVGSIGWLAIGPSATGQTKEEEAARKRAAVAIAAIEKLGGKVEKDLKAPGQPVVKVILALTDECKDGDLVHLKAFPELRELNCEGFCKSTEKNHLTDAGLKHLKVLTKLESLNLEWHEGVTDAGLEHLSGLTSLRKLNLGATRVTESGVKELQKSLPKARISR